MMKKNAFILFFILNFLVFIAFAAPVSELEIGLEKAKYYPNEKLEGNITINFADKIKPDEKLVVEFVGNEYEKEIKDVLQLLNLSYEKEEPKIELKNPEEEKELVFNDGSRYFGIRLPYDANVTHATLSISGESDNDLAFPKIDFMSEEANEILWEWQYYGIFDGYKDETKTSFKEEEVKDYEEIGLGDNLTLYCDVINLEGSNFVVNATYKGPLVDDENLNPVLKAVIIPLLSWTYGSEEIDVEGDLTFSCELPPQNRFKLGGCEIETDIAFHGPALVCLYLKEAYNNGTPIYKIKTIRRAPPSAGYYCYVEYEEDAPPYVSVCDITDYTDFIILVKEAEYNGVVKSELNFQKWFTNYLSFETVLNKILEDCEPDEVGRCNIIANVSALNSGKLHLKDLEITYQVETGAGYTTSTTRHIYDVERTPELITEINNTNITNYTLVVPLGMIANITVPNITQATKVLSLYAECDGKSDTIGFLVYGKISEVEDAKKAVEETLESLEDLKSATDERKKIIELLELKDTISQAITELQTYSTQIETVEKSEASYEEKREQLKDIYNSTISLRENLPMDITIKNKVSDIVVVEPDDITEDIVEEGKRDEVAAFQNNFEVKIDVSNFVLEKFSHELVKKNLVEVTITTSETVKNVDIYLVVDKGIAENVADIIFEQTPEIVKADPIVKWHKSTFGNEVKFSFIIDKEEQVNPYDIKMIVVPLGEEVNETAGAETVECGDGVCTRPLEDEITCPQDCKAKMPWGVIITILLVVIVAVGLISAYKFSPSFRALLKRKKNPFKSEADLNAVMNYIKASLEQKKTIEEIGNVLASKGWTEEQINYALNELKLREELERKTKVAPEKSEKIEVLKDYIEKCIQKGLKKEEIINKLVEKGWDKKFVESVYKKIKFKSFFKPKK